MREPKGNRTTSASKNNPPPPGGYTPLCGLCLRPVEPDGRCADCGGWPGWISPVDPDTGIRLKEEGTRRFAWQTFRPKRACPACAGPVTVDGGCDACEAQVGPSLIYPSDSQIRGIWIEQQGEGPFPIPFPSGEEVTAKVRAIVRHLARTKEIPGPVSSVEQARRRFKRQHDTDDVPF